MKKQHRGFLTCLCLASASLTACDGSDEAIPIGMWSPVERSDEATSAAALARASLARDSLAITPAGTAAQSEHYPKKNLEPTDDLVIAWLRWALAQPHDGGSISDPTGELCGLDQDGPVWFLAGTFGGPAFRECSIPAGKRLFFPLVNRWCVFPDEFYGGDAALIAADLPFVEDWFDMQSEATCSLTLRIDGQDVRPDLATLDEDTYIRVMEPFEIDLDDEHWATEWFAGGTMPAVGDGHYALIQPLTPGDHVLELGGTICGEYPFSTAVTYVLHVG